MKIYRINATQGSISFSQNIKALSYDDAKNKFKLQNSKSASFYPYAFPDLEINKITKRY